MLKIAFFGLPLAALLLDRDGHELVYAGLCRKGAIGERRLRAKLGARVAKVPRLDGKLNDKLAALAPDLLVSWYWTNKLPETFLKLAPLGTVGVHPSLLPRHRGPDPTFWTLLRGDAVTGVTAHRLERDYDTGAMLGSRTLEVAPHWNSWTLAKKLDRPSLALLRDVVMAFARGDAPREIAQDPAFATEAPSPTEEELRLDFRRPAEELLRLVRAASPFPGAWFQLEDEIVVVTRAAVEVGLPRALEPANAYVHRGRAVVRTADFGLVLLAGRLVGDDQEIDLDEGQLANLVARLSEGPRLA